MPRTHLLKHMSLQMHNRIRLPYLRTFKLLKRPKSVVITVYPDGSFQVKDDSGNTKEYGKQRKTAEAKGLSNG